MSHDLDRWFTEQVLSLEQELTRFLARRWRVPAEVPDLRQEIYVRVYEAARAQLPQAPRAFLYATARNLMADRIRRGKVVSIEAVADFEQLNVTSPDAGPEQQESSRQELKRLQWAFDLLPPRCREVIWLRRVRGLSQREVAEQLQIAEGTVEKQVAKGIRRLTQLLSGDEAGHFRDEAADGDASGRHYEQSRKE